MKGQWFLYIALEHAMWNLLRIQDQKIDMFAHFFY
jgi:hypothetical protein